MKQVNKYIASLDIPEGVEIALGGTTEKTRELMPDLFATIIAALVVIFGFIVFHFRKISLSVLSMAVSTLCIFGGFFGLWLFRMDFTLTCVLGFVSLIGIIVRNAIIMYGCGSYDHGSDGFVDADGRSDMLWHNLHHAARADHPAYCLLEDLRA